jgi:ribulose-5-phosphate 4-epimerase/fuculose-1-phosphate aldolase
MTYAIRDARIDIAALHRWGAKLGLNEGVNGGHLSLMVPGRDDAFLTIPNGLHWAEAAPDNLIMVNFKGETIEGQGKVERALFHIHTRLHVARPDARCILHSHCPWATTLSMLKDGRIRHYGQQTLRFYGRIAYYDEYNALAHGDSEADRMAASLGDRDVLFLANHGVIVCGPTAGQAFDDLYFIERACQTQVLAMQTGAELKPIPEEMAQLAVKQYGGQRENCELHWASLKRMLAAEDSRFAEPLMQAAE